MPFPNSSGSGESNDVPKREWQDFCKAPNYMNFEPPLPSDYTAWIHRCGYVMYCHEPTQQPSWMHPGKLQELEAKGLKGPGKIGSEMYIWEANRNTHGYYAVDYGYPPKGKIVEAIPPCLEDYRQIDEFGWDAWEAKMEARKEENYRKAELRSGQSMSPEELLKLREYLQMKNKMRAEQGFGRHRKAHNDNETSTNSDVEKESVDNEKSNMLFGRGKKIAS